MKVPQRLPGATAGLPSSAPIRWCQRYALRSALCLAGFKCRWSKVDRSRSCRLSALLVAEALAATYW